MAIIGLIPAAGRGSRLSPLPFSKELFPIGYQDIEIDGSVKKRPKVVSQYLVNHMVDAGAEKIFVTLGPHKSDIMEYFGSGERHHVNMAYNFQDEPKGMPFALDLSYSFLGKEDTVLFGMSDTIIEPALSLKNLLGLHQKNNADLTLGLFRTQNPSKFGMVDLEKETHRVITTIDKPEETDLAYMWGCCIWNYSFATYMHNFCEKIDRRTQSKEIVFGDIINSAITDGLSVYGEPIKDGRYIDIGTIEDLDTALKNFHL